MSSNYSVVIPAAGIGRRMGSTTPKQYLNLHDKTVLEHTVSRLHQHHRVEHVIVVLHPKDTVFKSLEIAKLENIHSVVGGDERVDSVLSGLKYLNHIPRSSDWIMVHDAARPCVSNKDIDTLIETVESAASSDISGAILAMRVRDTMKRSKPENGLNVSLKTVPREDLWHALTPQLFSIQSLIESIERALDKGYPVTDEASAMEASGHAVALVEGSTKNIKITTPEDLDLAAFYLAESSKQTKRRD